MVRIPPGAVTLIGDGVPGTEQNVLPVAPDGGEGRGLTVYVTVAGLTQPLPSKTRAKTGVPPVTTKLVGVPIEPENTPVPAL